MNVLAIIKKLNYLLEKIEFIAMYVNNYMIIIMYLKFFQFQMF